MVSVLIYCSRDDDDDDEKEGGFCENDKERKEGVLLFRLPEASRFVS